MLLFALILTCIWLVSVAWALNANTSWDVRQSGSDSSGGGFAVGNNTYSITNLSGATCRSATPTVASASYTFVNGDNGYYLWTTGGSFVSGLYKILSQSGGTATLAPTNFTANNTNGSPTLTSVSSFTGLWVGMAINGTGIVAGTTILAMFPSSSTITLSANCTSTNSPITVTQNVGTADTPAATGSASINRSREHNSAFTNGTNLTVDASTNTKVNPDGYTVVTADVGNIIQITTAGTGAAFTTGFYQIIAVTTGGGQRWTLDRSPAAVNSAGATWAMGGSLATMGKLVTPMLASNAAFVQGSFTIASAITFSNTVTPTGATANTRFNGYTSVWGDNGQATITSSASLANRVLVIAVGASIQNFTIDANSQTTTGCLTVPNISTARNCIIKNYTSIGIFQSSAFSGVLSCEFLGGTSAATAGVSVNSAGSLVCACTFHDCSCAGVSNGGAAGWNVISNNLFVNLLGSTADGFVNAAGSSAIGVFIANNTFFNLGRDGIRLAQSGPIQQVIKNNIFHTMGVTTTGYGISATTAGQDASWGIDGNAYYNNNANANNRLNLDDIGGTNLGNAFVPWGLAQDVILSADPFVKARAQANDLTIDASNNLKITSTGYNFTAGDVGAKIYIYSSGSGWTRGEYTIDSVASNAAVLHTSPGTTGSTGGVWYFNNFQLNNVASGGAACRTFGAFNVLPVYSTISYADLGGAYQHQDATQYAVYTSGIYTVRASNVTAATSSSVSLDAGATSTTDFYKGQEITIIAGTGLGQTRFITTNTNASPPVCTIHPNWSVTPDTTSVYSITPQAGVDIQSYDNTTVSGNGQFQKNVAVSNFAFTMISSTDHVSPLAGLGAGVTSQRSIDGAAFASTTNTAAEIGLGVYRINLSAADLNGDQITFVFTGSGADQLTLTIYTT